MPGLGTSFGRGAATTFQRDLQHSDCVLIMGSNMAEAHPVGFRFPLMAREKGATLIHVDPHFSRTSALCDLYVPIRAGTDIAFLGGVIRYVLENDLWFQEYVRHYTNASTIINQNYQDTEDLDGLFDGYQASQQRYGTVKSWQYASERSSPPTEMPQESGAESWSERLGAIDNPNPERDETLQHPRCVLQILKRHYSRYTPEMVASICGCPARAVAQVAEAMCRNSGRERTSSIVYAVGWTQHTTGVQIIRAAGILQLLLGNIGRPGGGIMAMRGHASIQGSTDIPTLYNLLPGYIPQPATAQKHETLARYLRQEHVANGVWSSFPKYAVSLLKAWYGEAATAENDFGFHWVPKIDENYSQLDYAYKMAEGKVKGYVIFGQNPAGGNPNARLARAGLQKLEWLVVLDWFETETACYWYKDPGGMEPKKIPTEVFFVPAAMAAEKDGCFTNTSRMVQWHDKAADPPGDARADTWFVYQLGLRLKHLYRESTRRRDQGLLNLTWDYAEDETPRILPDGTPSRIEGEPDAEKILREINGYRVADREQVKSYHELKEDGSTACGCWIYSGVFPEHRNNRSRSRQRTPGNYAEPEWAWSWPANTRMMYNRASADPEGRPWSERKKYVWWDAERKEWSGLDHPDFEPRCDPSYRPGKHDHKMAAIGGDSPFIMKPDGKGWLFAPSGTKDGPLPTHYEPIESPLKNVLYGQQFNPVAKLYPQTLNRYSKPADPKYAIVATTFRLTEHYLSGAMSRHNSWLSELQPEMFVEMSPQLAGEKGIRNGDWITIWNARTAIEARALVTPRVMPLRLDGRTVHQICIPFHWGYAGEVVGAVANDLTSLVTDPNVSIHEAKAFACNLRAGRHAKVRRPPRASPMRPWPEAEMMPATAAAAQPEGIAIRKRPERKPG